MDSPDTFLHIFFFFFFWFSSETDVFYYEGGSEVAASSKRELSAHSGRKEHPCSLFYFDKILTPIAFIYKI